MQVEQNQKQKMTEGEQAKFDSAKQDFDKIMKELEPSLKKGKKKRYQSSGEWITLEIQQEQ